MHPITAPVSLLITATMLLEALEVVVMLPLLPKFGEH